MIINTRIPGLNAASCGFFLRVRSSKRRRRFRDLVVRTFSFFCRRNFFHFILLYSIFDDLLIIYSIFNTLLYGSPVP